MKLIESKEIPLKDIVPCPLIIDRDDLGNLDEITGDIFTAIIVRLSKTREGKIERITGYRRFRKALKDKKKTIRCDIYEMTDEEALLTHSKENFQRKNLNVIEEGIAYDNLLKKLNELRGNKVTQEELAKILTGAGKKTSQERISNTMRLLKLAKPVQNYLALNKLGVYKGLLLLQITDDGFQTTIAEEFVRKRYTDEQAEERLRQLKRDIAHDLVQTRFKIKGNKYVHFLPTPDIIQPEREKIRLQYTKPYCSKVMEMIHEGCRLQAINSIHCRACPVFDLCSKFVKYDLKFELEKRAKEGNKKAK